MELTAVASRPTSANGRMLIISLPRDDFDQVSSKWNKKALSRGGFENN